MRGNIIVLFLILGRSIQICSEFNQSLPIYLWDFPVSPRLQFSRVQEVLVVPQAPFIAASVVFESTLSLHLFHTVVNEVSSFEKKLGAVLWLASPFRKNFWSARALELKVKTMECFCFSECLCFRCECPLVWRSSLLSPSWVAFEAPVFSPATAPEVEPPSQNREWAGSSYLSAAITGSLAWVTGSLTGSREQVEDATPALCGRRRPARGWGESVPLLLVPSVWYGVSVSLSRGTSVRLFSDTADSHCSHWLLADFLR